MRDTFQFIVCRRLAFLTLVLMPCLSVRAQESNAVPALEGLVREWVDLRGQIAAEKHVATEQQDQLSSEIALLEKERSALHAELDAAAQQQRTVDQEQLALAERKDRLAAATQAMLPALDRAEADLRRWRDRMPPPLAPMMAECFDRLPRTPTEAAALKSAQRLQAVIAGYTRLEDLGRTVHAAKEILRDAGGTRREMEVLYLGLARAYAVSPDGAWAGVATPANDGWHWDSRPELAASIRALLAVQKREQVAHVVPLPVRITDVAE